MISKLYRDNVTADEIGRWNLYYQRVNTYMDKWIIYGCSALLIAIGCTFSFPQLSFCLFCLIGMVELAAQIMAISTKNIVVLRAGQKQAYCRNRKRRTKYKLIRTALKTVEFIICFPPAIIAAMIIIWLSYKFKIFTACIFLALAVLLIFAELQGKNNWPVLRKKLVSKQELEAARKLSPDKFEDVSKLVDFFVMTGDYEEADHYSRKLLSMAQALPVIADNAENRELCA